jgi:hypothetical protein
MPEALADVHLAEPAAAGRYQSHDLLRAYALELLAAAQHATSTGMHAVAWHLPAVIAGLVERSGHSSDWLRTVEAALPSARALGDRHAECAAGRSSHARQAALGRTADNSAKHLSR